jgi:cardiolipin synthase
MAAALFLAFAALGVLLLALIVVLALFAPGLPYTIARPPSVALDSPEFFRILEALSDAQCHHRASVEVLSDGECYYPAALEAIGRAVHSVNLEAYIFSKGRVTGRFLEVMTERARAGVEVRLVLDSVGSFATWESYLRPLREAGGRICWYHPLRWHTLPRFNNRTHRELIVVDGRVAFLGGAGFADWWQYGLRGKRRWRDSMFRVEGDAVSALQATFVENWVEASGEILASEADFPDCAAAGRCSTLVVNSSPSAGLSTRARMLFQTLLGCARSSICITTPYFVPDRSVRDELVRAVRERGVSVSVIAPGRHTDQRLTRGSSRRLYGPLLLAGVAIHEYVPAMIHVKSLVVDELWSVVGSTNFDNRSFGINDELNLAVRDARFARRLLDDFERDLAQSRRISFEDWSRRALLERAHEQFGRLIERQQ